jgi:hypothetical protein
LVFPAPIRINNYGFIGVLKSILEALSWHKGEKLTIDKNADGSARSVYYDRKTLRPVKNR